MADRRVWALNSYLESGFGSGELFGLQITGTESVPLIAERLLEGIPKRGLDWKSGEYKRLKARNFNAQ